MTNVKYIRTYMYIYIGKRETNKINCLPWLGFIVLIVACVEVVMAINKNKKKEFDKGTST